MKSLASKNIIIERKREKGQALIEFVGVVPLILFCIGLIVISGQWVYLKLNAQNLSYSECSWIPRMSRQDQSGYFPSRLNAEQGTNKQWDRDYPNYYSVGGSGRTGGAGCNTELLLAPPQENPEGGLPIKEIGAESGGYWLFAPFISCDTDSGPLGTSCR